MHSLRSAWCNAWQRKLARPDRCRGEIGRRGAQPVLLDGGKLINPHTKAPVNTRISAVIALKKFPVGQREFRVALAKKERTKTAGCCGRRATNCFSGNKIYTSERRSARSFTKTLHEPQTAERDLHWAVRCALGAGPSAPYISRLYAGLELEQLEAEEDELGFELGSATKKAKKRQRKSFSD